MSRICLSQPTNQSTETRKKKKKIQSVHLGKHYDPFEDACEETPWRKSCKKLLYSRGSSQDCALLKDTLDFDLESAAAIGEPFETGLMGNPKPTCPSLQVCELPEALHSPWVEHNSSPIQG